MIRDQYYETLPREELEALQLRRLQAMVERVYHLVPFYRQRLDEAGFKPEQLRTLADLDHLPFTVKQDIRDNYPFKMFAVPMEQVVRLHASSGTTGKPTPVGYTARDLETWGELMARVLAAAGLHRGDIVHVAYGYGLFTGGLGFHYGVERLGAAVIPVSGGQTRRQIMLIEDFAPNALCCTPSFALYLAEVGQQMGVNFKDTSLRVGIFGAEPWSEAMRQEIEARLGIDALDIYGLSEMMGARRGCRVPGGQGRPPPLRGPLPAGNHRPRDAQAPAARRDRRVGDHHPHQGSLSPDPLPHPGRHLP